MHGHKAGRICRQRYGERALRKKDRSQYVGRRKSGVFRRYPKHVRRSPPHIFLIINDHRNQDGYPWENKDSADQRGLLKIGTVAYQIKVCTFRDGITLYFDPLRHLPAA